MTKNEVKRLVPDVCVQHLTLRIDDPTTEVLNKKAMFTADGLGTGLICWWWHGEKNRLDVFTSYDFKDFLDCLKPGAKITNRAGKEFTIESEPYLENGRMCVRANGDTWFCDTLYDASKSYKEAEI